jgi:hypothetical protein
MKGQSKHEHFCSAGQLAPCEGYFPTCCLVFVAPKAMPLRR